MEKIEIILNKILESQEKMEKEIFGMKDEFASVKSDVAEIKSEMTGMKSEITGIKSEMTKFSVIQEKMQRDIELLSEGHSNIIETTDRKLEEIRKEFNDRLDEVEAAVTNLGEDVKFIKHKEFQNEESIFKLKQSVKLAK